MTNDPQEFNGGVPGGNYTAEQAPNGTWTIKGLPIFSEVEPGKRGNQQHVGPEWMNAAIAKAKELRFNQQHMAPVHLGHHGALKNKETPRVGFLKPMDVNRLMIEGKPQWCLFADVVGISQENFDQLKNLSHPYRSVEIGDWNKPEIASLALLSDESPYFKFPMLTIGQMKAHAGKKPINFGAEWDGNYQFFEFAGAFSPPPDTPDLALSHKRTAVHDPKKTYKAAPRGPKHSKVIRDVGPEVFSNLDSGQLEKLRKEGHRGQLGNTDRGQLKGVFTVAPDGTTHHHVARRSAAQFEHFHIANAALRNNPDHKYINSPNSSYGHVVDDKMDHSRHDSGDPFSFFEFDDGQGDGPQWTTYRKGPYRTQPVQHPLHDFAEHFGAERRARRHIKHSKDPGERKRAEDFLRAKSKPENRQGATPMGNVVSLSPIGNQGPRWLKGFVKGASYAGGKEAPSNKPVGMKGKITPENQKARHKVAQGKLIGRVARDLLMRRQLGPGGVGIEDHEFADKPQNWKAKHRTGKYKIKSGPKKRRVGFRGKAGRAVPSGQGEGYFLDRKRKSESKHMDSSKKGYPIQGVIRHHEFAVSPPNIRTVSSQRRGLGSGFSRWARGETPSTPSTPNTPNAPKTTIGEKLRTIGSGIAGAAKKVAGAVRDEYGDNRPTAEQLYKLRSSSLARQTGSGVTDRDREVLASHTAPTLVEDAKAHRSEQRRRSVEARKKARGELSESVPIWFREFSGMPLWAGEYFSSQPTDFSIRNGQMIGYMKAMARANRTSKLSPGGRIDGQGFHDFNDDDDDLGGRPSRRSILRGILGGIAGAATGAGPTAAAIGATVGAVGGETHRPMTEAEARRARAKRDATTDRMGREQAREHKAIQGRWKVLDKQLGGRQAAKEAADQATKGRSDKSITGSVARTALNIGMGKIKSAAKNVLIQKAKGFLAKKKTEKPTRQTRQTRGAEKQARRPRKTMKEWLLEKKKKKSEPKHSGSRVRTGHMGFHEFVMKRGKKWPNYGEVGHPSDAGSLGFHEFAWKEGTGEEWKGDRHDPSDPDNNLPFKPFVPRGPEGLSLKKGVAPPKKWFHHERRWEWDRANPKDKGKKNIQYGLTDREVPGGYPNQKGYWPTGREVRAYTQRMGPDAQKHIKKRMEKEGISYKKGATDYRKTLNKIDRDFGWSTNSRSAHPNFKPWSGVSHAVRSRKGYVEPGPRGAGLHEFLANDLHPNNSYYYGSNQRGRYRDTRDWPLSEFAERPATRPRPKKDKGGATKRSLTPVRDVLFGRKSLDKSGERTGSRDFGRTNLGLKTAAGRRFRVGGPPTERAGLIPRSQTKSQPGHNPLTGGLAGLVTGTANTASRGIYHAGRAIKKHGPGALSGALSGVIGAARGIKRGSQAVAGAGRKVMSRINKATEKEVPTLSGRSQARHGLRGRSAERSIRKSKGLNRAGRMPEKTKPSGQREWDFHEFSGYKGERRMRSRIAQAGQYHATGGKEGRLGSNPREDEGKGRQPQRDAQRRKYGHIWDAHFRSLIESGSNWSDAHNATKSKYGEFMSLPLKTHLWAKRLVKSRNIQTGPGGTDLSEFGTPLGMNGQAKRLNSRLQGGNLLKLNRNGQASNGGTGLVGDSALRRRSNRTAHPFAPSATFGERSKAKWKIQPPGIGWYSEI